MKTIKEIENEIAGLEFELKLKRADGTNAMYNSNIRILQEKVKSLKDVLKLINERIEKNKKHYELTKPPKEIDHLNMYKQRLGELELIKQMIEGIYLKPFDEIIDKLAGNSLIEGGK